MHTQNKITISVIVPTFNEEQHIERLIKSLLDQSVATIVIVDGGSTDRTLSLIAKYPMVRLVLANKGRANQMNAGAEQVIGDVLLFLHADSIVPRNGVTLIRNACSNGALGGSFYVRFDHASYILKVYSWFSRFNFSLFTYGDQGIFIRTKVFEQIGGYANVDLLEDLILVRQIKKMGKFQKLSKPILTSARRFLKYGIIRQQIKNMAIVILFSLGVSTVTLAKWYNRRN